jgi:flagellar L-ring protein precursor FlgH
MCQSEPNRNTLQANSRALLYVVVLILCSTGTPALAQHNSLLGLKPDHSTTGADLVNHEQVPATSQPAQPGALITPSAGPAPLPAPPRPKSRAVNGFDPPPNPVLLAVSPIAFEPPRPQVIEVNSLVTIIIRESRTSLNDAKLKSEKDWQTQATLAQWFRLQDCNLVAQEFPNGAPGIDWDFQNTYDTKGKYDRKDELTTRITARVIDVKPNGNLVLEARKRIKTGEEVLLATLTGECRSQDVTAANTVLSTQIADLEIEMPDRGAVHDATTRGWLMRALDFLKPF